MHVAVTRLVLDHASIRRTTAKAGTEFLKKVLPDFRIAARIRAGEGLYFTGELAASIESTPIRVLADRVTASVGSRKKYAASVEFGANPHMIFPRGNYNLRFFWEREGKWMSLPFVHHPGQKGKKYLRDSLRSVGEKHGMRVVIYNRG